VTIDGTSTRSANSAVPFTIPSRLSKAFVFALALEAVGEERVSAAIGVEPSGRGVQFDSVLTNDQPAVHPMVNAGAIACSGLIHQAYARWRSRRSAKKLSEVCRARARRRR